MNAHDDVLGHYVTQAEAISFPLIIAGLAGTLAMLRASDSGRRSLSRPACSPRSPPARLARPGSETIV